MESTKVIIKAIPRQTATKISEFTNKTSGKKMNKNKIGKCKDVLRAFYSEKTGSLVTGLEEVINNPYFESNRDLPQEFQYIRKEEKITLQDLLEIKHRVPKGTYTNRAWRPGDGYKDEQLTFFQRFKYKLNDGATILDLAKPMDEIAYYMLKSHPMVALSNKMEDKIKRPKAEYYISDKNESIQEKYTKKKFYNSAVEMLNDKKFTVSYQKKLAKALDLVKGDVSTMKDESIYLLLDTYLEDSYKSNKDENITNFIDNYKLTTSVEGRNELEAICLLSDLVNYRIVTDAKGTYTWVSKQIQIGQRKAEAIDFLLDPKKQPERDELERQLKAKMLR